MRVNGAQLWALCSSVRPGRRGILPEALHQLPAPALAKLDESPLLLLKCVKAKDRSGRSTPLAIMLGER